MTFDPSKWQVVPKEPTPEMRDAGADANEQYDRLVGVRRPDKAGAIAAYKAMLAHAPQAPVVAGDAVELAVQASIDAGLAVDGRYGVGAARHAARFVLGLLASSRKEAGTFDDGIEAAAKVADDHAEFFRKFCDSSSATAARHIAKDIRALKSKPSPQVDRDTRYGPAGIAVAENLAKRNAVNPQVGRGDEVHIADRLRSDEGVGDDRSNRDLRNEAAEYIERMGEKAEEYWNAWKTADASWATAQVYIAGLEKMVPAPAVSGDGWMREAAGEIARYIENDLAENDSGEFSRPGIAAIIARHFPAPDKEIVEALEAAHNALEWITANYLCIDVTDYNFRLGAKGCASHATAVLDAALLKLRGRV